MEDSHSQLPDPISHGLDERRPIAAKWERWDNTGPGVFEMHAELEFGIVLDGVIARESDGHQREFACGECWFGGMWQAHSAHVVRAPLEVLVVHCHPLVLDAMVVPERPGWSAAKCFTAALNEQPHMEQSQRQELHRLGSELAHWLADAPTVLTPQASYSRAATASSPATLPCAGRERLRLRVLEMILVATDQWRVPLSAQGPGPVVTLLPALSLAQQRPTPVLTEHAALACEMSRSRFDRQFSRLTGTTFTRFHLRSRLARAAYRLRHSDVPIKQIAADFGFSDASHFTKVFQEAYRLTPAKYRQQLQNG